MHVVGLAARQHNLGRGPQANTQRKSPVFSTFFLAKLVVRRRLHAKTSDRMFAGPCPNPSISQIAAL
jgi:hypothetical protein